MSQFISDVELEKMASDFVTTSYMFEVQWRTTTYTNNYDYSTGHCVVKYIITPELGEKKINESMIKCHDYSQAIEMADRLNKEIKEREELITIN